MGLEFVRGRKAHTEASGGWRRGAAARAGAVARRLRRGASGALTGVLAFLGVAAAFLAGVLAFLGAAAFLVGVFLTLGAAACARGG